MGKFIKKKLVCRDKRQNKQTNQTNHMLTEIIDLIYLVFSLSLFITIFY